MSKPIKDGGQAFPGTDPDGVVRTGMTLRDWFAGQALSGWLASFGPDTAHPADMRGREQACANVARFSYVLADAMLAARGAR